MIRTDAELLEAVNVLLPESGYVLCPGIPMELYSDCVEVVRFHSKEVRCFLEPTCERYEATGCLLWHKPPYKKMLQCHPMHDSCTSCKKVKQHDESSCLWVISYSIFSLLQVFSHLRQLAVEAIKCEPEVRASRREPSSNYSWSKLSPASQQTRRFNVVKERRDYMAKAKRLADISS